MLARAWTGDYQDFSAYYQAGARALAGRSPYVLEETPFKYPPAFALVFLPLALLPMFAAKLVWAGLSLVAGWDVYRRAWPRIGGVGVFWVMLTMARFHNYDLLNVQINHVCLWLLWMGLMEQPSRLDGARRGVRSLWASVGVVAALCAKVLPAVALVPLWRAGPRVRRFEIAVVLLVLALWPLQYWGGIHVYSEWLALMRATTPYPAPEGEILQSIQAMSWWGLGRLGLRDWVGADRFAAAMAGLSLVAVLTYALWSWRSRVPLVARVMVGVTLATVLSPLAWKHNYLCLLPAIVWLWEQGERAIVRGLALVWTGLPLLFTLLGAPYWANRGYFALWGGLGLVVALVRVGAREQGTDPKKTGSEPCGALPVV